MLLTRLWRCSTRFASASDVGGALVPRLARRPSRRFLVVSLCAARRVAVFPSAHLVFEFLFRRVFFVGARFMLFAVVLFLFAIFCCG